jgi:hypothetical protein
MLESDGSLRTWVLAELPRDWATLLSKLPARIATQLRFAAGNTVVSERLADHRLAYLDYEGPLSGERGNVTRIDGGTFEPIEETPDAWEVNLTGEILAGPLSLRRVSESSAMWHMSVGAR